jgi:UDP-2,3-diacylglucosamine pyrophosphatase LpxH
MAQALDLDLRETPDGRKLLHFPFMSISDIHWGTKGSRARRLSRLLEHTSADRIQLPGDIIGGTEQLEKPTWHFGGIWHVQGMGHILRKAAQGTRVVYNPGNHDYFADRLHGKTLAGIQIEKESVYIDPKGRSGKIEHGHRFDENIFRNRASQNFWYRVGDRFLMKTEDFDSWVVRKVPPLAEHFCSAAIFKRAFKVPFNMVTGIDRAITQALDKSSHKFSISGHSHGAEIKRTPAGKLQMNDGSCTEEVQALVHDAKGRWALLTIYKKGMTVEMENLSVKGGMPAQSRHKYFVSWDSLGLAEQMTGEPTVYQDVFTEQAQRIQRIVCRAYPPQDRAALKAEIQHHESLSAEFLAAIKNGKFRSGAEFVEERQRRTTLNTLRDAYRILPVPDPRRARDMDRAFCGPVKPPEVVELELKYA